MGRKGQEPNILTFCQLCKLLIAVLRISPQTPQAELDYVKCNTRITSRITSHLQMAFEVFYELRLFWFNSAEEIWKIK